MGELEVLTAAGGVLLWVEKKPDLGGLAEGCEERSHCDSELLHFGRFGWNVVSLIIDIDMFFI